MAVFYVARLKGNKFGIVRKGQSVRQGNYDLPRLLDFVRQGQCT